MATTDLFHTIQGAFLHRIKKWGFFEYTFIVLVLAALIGMSTLYSRSLKSEYITITVLLANRDRQYNDGGALSPIETQLFTVGLTGKDAFGHINAEITDVEAFQRPQITTYGTKETTYVTVKTLASYNAQSGTYIYKGENVKLGDWIRIDIGPVLLEGIVYDLQGRFQKTQEQTMTVNAQLKTEDPMDQSVFSNTTGVDPYIANAIHVGDTMIDSHARVLAKVLDKIVQPAQTLTVDAYGNLQNRPNPRKVDVFLALELHVKKVKGEAYFLDVQPVKVNSRVPLFLPSISVEPRITEIIK